MSDNNNDKPGFGDTIDTNGVGTVRVVYRPKDENEAKRRVNRMEALEVTGSSFKSFTPAVSKDVTK